MGYGYDSYIRESYRYVTDDRGYQVRSKSLYSDYEQENLSSLLQSLRAAFPERKAPVYPGNPQAEIDRKLREKLEEPRIAAEQARQEAEVERRLELAAKLKTNDDYKFGDVIKFDRTFGTDTEFTKAKTYSYVALKSGDGNWYVSGANQARSGGWKFDDLVEWLLTGENVVSNVKVATEWTEIF